MNEKDNNGIESFPSPDSQKFIPSNLLNNILAKQKLIFYEIFPFLDFVELEIKIKLLSKEIYTLYTNYMKIKEHEKEDMKNCLKNEFNEELFLKYLKHPFYGIFQKTKFGWNEYEQIIDLPSLVQLVAASSGKIIDKYYVYELVILPKVFKNIYHIVKPFKLTENEYKICSFTNGYISVLKKTRTGENFFWTHLGNNKFEKLTSSSADKYELYFGYKDNFKIKVYNYMTSIYESCIKICVDCSIKQTDDNYRTVHTFVEENCFDVKDKTNLKFLFLANQ
jgi:hypothetical protein